MGLTALVATILGIVGGAIPRILGIVESRGNHVREMEFLKLQHQMQIERSKSELDTRMREADTTLMLEEVRAMREHVTAIVTAQARPTGFAWIDAFNALLRPSATAVILVLFLVFSGVLINLYWHGQIQTAEQLSRTVSTSLLGLAFEGLLGFLFGVRTTLKRG